MAGIDRDLAALEPRQGGDVGIRVICDDWLRIALIAAACVLARIRRLGVAGFAAGALVAFELLGESDGFTEGCVTGDVVPCVLGVGFFCTSGTAITAFELSLRLPKSSTTRPGTVPPLSGNIL